MALRQAQPQLNIQSFPRDAFIEDYWDYSAGEHVTFLGPTQSGKTTLAYQLLGESATEKLPAIVLVMKPKDPVVTDWTKRYKWKKVETWPPVDVPYVSPKRSGYVLWPKHSFDPDKDNPKLHREFRKAMLYCYEKGDRILFADELYGVDHELKLRDEVITIYSRGAAMGCGLWAATQKPSHIPLWAYSQAEHLFLANDPDKRARERYGEIGGIDPKFVEAQTLRLPKYHWLYIRRTGPVACIVEP